MQVNYELTKDDFLEFNLFHMTYSKTLSRALFIQRYLLSLIFLLVPFVIARFTTIPLWYWLIVFGLLYIVWVLFYGKYLRWSSRKRISRMIDEGNNADMLGAHVMKLEEDGLVNAGRLGETKTSYEAIERVIETKDYVYIYVSSVMAYIIPNRSFTSIDQKEEFVDKLRQEIDSLG